MPYTVDVNSTLVIHSVFIDVSTVVAILSDVVSSAAVDETVVDFAAVFVG